MSCESTGRGRWASRTLQQRRRQTCYARRGSPTVARLAGRSGTATARGSFNVARVPAPGAVSTFNSPPSARASAWTVP